MGNIQNLLDYCKNCRKWLPENEWKNGEIALFTRVRVAFSEALLHVENTKARSGFLLSAENAEKFRKIATDISNYSPKS